MDFSVILILPFSAVVTFATVLWKGTTGRLRPRLIWPFAFSTLCAAAVFLGLPGRSSALVWVAMLFVVATWAAFGTVIGALIGKLVSHLLRIR